MSLSAILMVSALIAGRPVHAQHELSTHGDCIKVAVLLWHDLKAIGATEISLRCYEEPAT